MGPQIYSERNVIYLYVVKLNELSIIVTRDLSK